MGCPQADVLLRYVEQRCEPGEERGIDSHVETCPACRELLFTCSRPGDAAPPTSSDAAEPVPGESVDRYVLLRRIGRGGMGLVYLAYDPRLDRNVALKLIRGDSLDPRRQSQFRDEALAMARLTHPNVVRAYDVGHWNGRPFLSMEHVDGVNLAQWVASQSPSRREILTAVIDAGRGLAAAHEAGIVHCDVKPQNIFVHRDGRALIGDFGLAAMARTDARAGTPAYMAPEQLDSGTVSDKSDQYALAATLREALGGARVPAIDRAMRGDPDDRFATIEDFLAALRGPARRHWPAVAATVAVLVAAGSYLAFQRSPQARSEPCSHPERHLESTWNPAIRERLAGSLRAASGTDVGARVVDAVDRYASEWADMHRETCEATRVDGSQSEELLDRRMLCLQRRRRALAGLVQGMESAPGVAGIDSVDALPSLGDCANAESLAEREALPGDPALRGRIAELYAELDGARLPDRAADLPAQREQLGTLIDQSRRTGHRPLLAEALYRAAELAHVATDVEAAESYVREAIEVAAASHHEDVAARGSILLVSLRGVLGGSHAEAKSLETAARAAVARAGGDDALEHELRYVLAKGHVVRGEFAEAEAAIAEARTLGLTVHGEDSLEMTFLDNVEANLRIQQNRFDDARTILDRVVARREAALAPTHPDLATALNDRGSVLMYLGEMDQAKVDLQRSLETWRALGKADSSLVAGAHVNLGVVLSQAGELTAARRHFETALPILEELHGREHMNYTTALHGLAMLLEDQGELERAAELHAETLELRVKGLGSDHPTTGRSHETLGVVLGRLDRWQEALAHHRRARRIFEAALPPESPLRALPLLSEAHALRQLNRHDASLEVAREALAVARGVGDPRWIAEAQALVAAGWLASGRAPGKGERLASEAVSAYRNIDADHPDDELYQWLAARTGEAR